MCSNRLYNYLLLLTTITLLMAACSRNDDGLLTSDGNSQKEEIRFNVSTVRVTEGTRAVTYDIAEDLQKELSLTCSAYDADDIGINYEASIDKDAVTPVETSGVLWKDKSWLFTPSHYWPESVDLDFFAYMPATPPTYIYDMSDNVSSVSYLTARTPEFQCKSLPVVFDITSTPDATKEFICALTNGQNKTANAAEGVDLMFQHPFARINFKFSDATGNQVSVTQVKISSIKNNGSCTFNGGDVPQTFAWAPSGDATEFSVTGNLTNPVLSGSKRTDGPYLVMPQTFASTVTFTVTAVWDDWSDATRELTETVTIGPWEPGHSYTYTMTLYEHALKVDATNFTEQW